MQGRPTLYRAKADRVSNAQRATLVQPTLLQEPRCNKWTIYDCYQYGKKHQKKDYMPQDLEANQQWILDIKTIVDSI